MGRNKAPSENTIRMLCSRAAGMCEFEGCNKRLFYDNVTRKEFNNSFVAHIIASSSNGPRGDKTLSSQLSDKLENLMLMCADHHKLIDDSKIGPRDYPVEKLKKMKKEHEEKIEKLCSLFHVPQSEVVRFVSPIKGLDEVFIDLNEAAQAILPRYQPASTYGVSITISSSFDYGTREYWDDCMRQLNNQFQRSLNNPYIENEKTALSIFPLAPIPLIAKLGELIGDKYPCEVYQKTRQPNTWRWQISQSTSAFSIEKIPFENEGKNIAIILSLTGNVSEDRLPPTMQYKAIYKIISSEIGVDCIKSTEDLSLFWHAYQKVCDDILNSYGRDSLIHMFPAVPVSAAFEIGRRYMTGTYPQIIIYDENNGFIETIKIGDTK